MPVTIRALSHIVLPVSDLGASLAFYGDLLGLEVVMRLDPGNSDTEGSIAAGLDIAGLLVPGGTMLELVQGMQEPSAGSTVVALNVADVKAAQQQVEAVGITPAMPPTEVTPGVTMMFLTDPDGRTVELVEFESGVSTNYANLEVPSAS
ncbi:MAG: VOC family protein [Myxococcota bacterium]|nr:VOC family protein [Myxococcota bacterium]